ncbi:hypothetical protein A2J26_17050 [Salmonella enterica subsp. enterica serovar Cerro]|nr:hypothetical protein [Salmonella enterica subsp. enterica serovar Cerro]
MQTVVKRVIGNLEAKFNDNFAKIMRGIMMYYKAAISQAKKKIGGSEKFSKVRNSGADTRVTVRNRGQQPNNIKL